MHEAIGHQSGTPQVGSRDVGRPAPGLDLFIASTALVHGLTLVMHNTRDFADIPGLDVVDWLAP